MKFLKVLLCLIVPLTAWSAPTYKQVNNGIPSTLRAKLVQYLGQKRAIDVAVATKEGQWLVTGRGVRSYSNTAFFDRMKGSGSMPLRRKINEYIAAGRRIDAVGITRGNNWVVTSGNFRYYSSQSAFDQLGIRRVVESAIRNGQKITQIAIDKNNAWVVIAGPHSFFSSNIPADLRKAIIDSRSQGLRPRVVKFRPNSSQWIFIAGQKTYASKDLSRGAYDWANKYRNFNWEVNKVFMAPNGGWSVISNNTVTRGTILPEQLQYAVASQNIWQRMDLHKATAVSIAYIRNGRAQWLRTYGYADLAQNRLAYTDTPFAIASMSKAVGSYSMLHAAQQGFININKTLDKYIDANPSTYLSDWGETDTIQDDSPATRVRQSTIRRMLTHSSGFTKHGIGVQTTPIASLSDVLDGTHGSEVKYLADAGTIYDYSGGGYTVAESILDVEYAGGALKWLNGTVRALGMTNSTFGSLESKKDTMARLHNTKGEVYRYRECPVKTAGGLFSTPSDYTLFLRTLMNGGKTPSGRQLLSEPWNQVMFRPMPQIGSSLTSCRTSFNCSGGERCVAGQCMNAITTGSWFVSPGMRIAAPFDARTRRPTIVTHGGAQLSTRTNFTLNLQRREGIVVFVSGPAKWERDPTNPDRSVKGSDILLREILSSYRSLVGW